MERLRLGFCLFYRLSGPAGPLAEVFHGRSERLGFLMFCVPNMFSFNVKQTDYSSIEPRI